MAPKFPGWKANYLHGTLIRSCWLAPAKLQPVKRLLISSPPARFQVEENRRRRCLRRPGRQPAVVWLKRIQKAGIPAAVAALNLAILRAAGVQRFSLHRLSTRRDFETVLLLISLEDRSQSVGNGPETADTLDKSFAFCRWSTLKLEGNWEHSLWK